MYKKISNFYTMVEAEISTAADFITHQPSIINMSQVAITMDYRYQPPARAPIDAGELLVDTRKVSDYRDILFLPRRSRCTRVLLGQSR